MRTFRSTLNFLVFTICLAIVFSACNSEEGQIITEDPSVPVYIDTFNEEKWRTNKLDDLRNIVVYNDFVLAIRGNSGFSIIDKSSGIVLWEKENVYNFRKENVFLLDDALYVSHIEEDQNTLLKKYDMQSGEVLESTLLTDENYNYTTSGNVLVGNIYYFIERVNKDEKEVYIRSYDLSSGQMLRKIKVESPEGIFQIVQKFGLSISEDENKAFFSAGVNYNENIGFIVKEISLANEEQNIIYSERSNSSSNKLIRDEDGNLIVIRGSIDNSDYIIIEDEAPYSVISRQPRFGSISGQAYIKGDILYNPLAPYVTYDYKNEEIIDEVEFLMGNLKFSDDGKYLFGIKDRFIHVYDLELNQIIARIGDQLGFSIFPYNFDLSADLQYLYSTPENRDLIVAYKLPEDL